MTLEKELEAAKRRREARTITISLLSGALGILLLSNAIALLMWVVVVGLAVWIHYSEEVERLERIIELEERR